MSLATQNANGKAPARHGGRELKTFLESQSERMAAALPKHITPERLIQVVTTLHYRTPKLQECDNASILASVLRACTLGLDLEPAMNEAFLIPRFNKEINGQECQFQIGYQGLRKLAMQSGAVASLQARLVRERDAFRYEFTPDLIFHHVPCLNGSPGPVVMVYAVAKLTNGEQIIEVMDADEVEAIHQRSDGYKTAVKKGWKESGPWVTDWNEMAKKTVLKRVCKSIPRSTELAAAINDDDVMYRSEDGEMVVVSSSPRRRKMIVQNPGESRAAALARSLSPPAPEPEFTEGTPGTIRTEADDPDDVTPEDYGGEPEPGSDG
jgi:recombination protein RecT